jgi:hypothetical protein
MVPAQPIYRVFLLRRLMHHPVSGRVLRFGQADQAKVHADTAVEQCVCSCLLAIHQESIKKEGLSSRPTEACGASYCVLFLRRKPLLVNKRANLVQEF